MKILGTKDESLDIIDKAYSDLHPQYVEVDADEAPQVGASNAALRMRLRVLDGLMYLDSTHDLSSADIRLGRLGRRSKKWTTRNGNELSKKTNGWRIVEPITANAIHNTVREHLFDSIVLKLSQKDVDRKTRARYPYRYDVRLCTDGGTSQLTAKYLTGCFGYIDGNGYWVVKKGHSRIIMDSVGYSASQCYAIVVNGIFLPFRVYQCALGDDNRGVNCSFGMTPSAI